MRADDVRAFVAAQAERDEAVKERDAWRKWASFNFDAADDLGDETMRDTILADFRDLSTLHAAHARMRERVEELEKAQKC